MDKFSVIFRNQPILVFLLLNGPSYDMLLSTLNASKKLWEIVWNIFSFYKAGLICKTKTKGLLQYPGSPCLNCICWCFCIHSIICGCMINKARQGLEAGRFAINESLKLPLLYPIKLSSLYSVDKWLSKLQPIYEHEEASQIIEQGASRIIKTCNANDLWGNNATRRSLAIFVSHEHRCQYVQYR